MKSGPQVFRIGDTYVLIAGLKGRAEIRFSRDFALVPASSFHSQRHLMIAVIRAIRSFKSGTNISENFAYELGICLLGIREVSKVKEVLSRDCEEYAFVSYCRNIGDCLRYLLRTLVRGFSLSDVSPSYIPEELVSCTGNIECLAMEKGIIVELER